MQNISSKLYTTGEVAKKLNVNIWKIQNLIYAGKIKDAALRLGGKRVFTDKDVESIKNVICKSKK